MKLNIALYKFSRSAVIIGLILIAQPAAATGPLSNEELLSKGRVGLAKLPAAVTSADAELFADAFRYVLAYQQRRPMRMKEDPQHAAEVNKAVAWFSSGLERIGGSGTSANTDELARESLKSEGLARYAKLPKTDKDISNKHAADFIGAMANLFAFDQLSAKEDTVVHNAVLRLEKNKARIRAASVIGNPDEPRPKWAPTTRKPGITKSREAISDSKPRKNDIRQFRATRTSPQVVNVSFDYSYVGDRGTDVYLNAIPLGPGRTRLDFGGCCGNLVVGEGSATITIEKPAAPRAESVSIDICMIARDPQKPGAFFCENFPFQPR